MLFAVSNGCQNAAIKSPGLEVFWIDPLVSLVSITANRLANILIVHLFVCFPLTLFITKFKLQVHCKVKHCKGNTDRVVRGIQYSRDRLHSAFLCYCIYQIFHLRKQSCTARGMQNGSLVAHYTFVFVLWLKSRVQIASYTIRRYETQKPKGDSTMWCIGVGGGGGLKSLCGMLTTSKTDLVFICIMHLHNYMLQNANSAFCQVSQLGVIIGCFQKWKALFCALFC